MRSASASMLVFCALVAFFDAVSSAERFIAVSQSKNWADANDYCSTTYGTTLATVRDAAEMDAVESLFSSIGGNLWIGLNDLSSEGTWVWVSGWDCEGDCDLDWWHSGEPNNSGDEDCAEVWTTYSTNDMSCSASRYFVCDGYSVMGPTTAPTAAAPTAEPTTFEPTAFPSVSPTLSAPHSFEVVAGEHFTCALYEHSVKCWGYNGNGQLGVGNTGNLYSPPEDPVDLGDGFVPIKLYCGYRHCCTVSNLGASKCWGRNSNGQLGIGSTSSRGDGSNEMGNNLQAIDWGTDFKVESMCTGTHHTCALSTDAVLKCVGYNGEGRLGYGHTTQLGDSTSELGDALEAVALGDDFEIVQVECGEAFTCARSAGGDLKCWGYNAYGQLAQGDNYNRGDHAGEMGNSLPPIRLGVGFEVMTVSTGRLHACAVSTDGDLKCWGYNGYGQLGYGDTTQRGDAPNEVDDNLPTVDLGTDFVVSDVAAGYISTCATSTSGAMKCWGYNGYGGLGQGSTAQRGDGSNEMGDYLQETNLGAGFTASGLRLPKKLGLYYWAFAFEESTSGPLLKCWGRNSYGQCGYGDTSQRGDGSNEMGDYLDFVDLGFTMSPTVDPSSAPTFDPTSAPTFDPTTEPTTDPTSEPTAAPTRCLESDMHSVNWHELFHGDSAEGDDLLQSYSVAFDESSFLLTLSATVQYVGRSADGHLDDAFNLGTTYWLDLQSFSGVSDGLSAAGSCANRLADDYDGLAFDEWWEFTVDPLDLESAPTAQRTAYPASEWSLSATDCTAVTYSRTFALADLSSCTDADGEALVTIDESAEMLSFRGSFFVELVSPYSMASSDYYRTYPLVQHEFALQLSRSADALASSGVPLFVSSVMSFGHSDDGDYVMRVLMLSADAIALGSTSAVVAGPVAVSGIAEESDGCLVDDGFSCAQVFAVTLPSALNCTDSAVIDFSGTFQIAFTPQCREVDDDEASAACSSFLGGLDESGNVVLDVDWNFVDETCGVDLFNVTIGADLTFYADDEFADAVEDEAFVIDRDTVFGQIELGLAADDESGAAFYELVAVAIENVFVCTADADLSATLSATSGSGGCLSSAVDANGYYIVIGSGADDDFDGETRYDVPARNMARFSFLAANLAFESERTEVYVHVQLLLTLQSDDGRRRRQRLLLDAADSNQIRHVIATTTVAAPNEADGEAFGTEEAVATTAGAAAIVAVVALFLFRRSRSSADKEPALAEVVTGRASHVAEMTPSAVCSPTSAAVTV